MIDILLNVLAITKNAEVIKALFIVNVKLFNVCNSQNFWLRKYSELSYESQNFPESLKDKIGTYKSLNVANEFVSLHKKTSITFDINAQTTSMLLETYDGYGLLYDASRMTSKTKSTFKITKKSFMIEVM